MYIYTCTYTYICICITTYICLLDYLFCSVSGFSPQLRIRGFRLVSVVQRQDEFASLFSAGKFQEYNGRTHT